MYASTSTARATATPGGFRAVGVRDRRSEAACAAPSRASTSRITAPGLASPRGPRAGSCGLSVPDRVPGPADAGSRVLAGSEARRRCSSASLRSRTPAARCLASTALISLSESRRSKETPRGDALSGRVGGGEPATSAWEEPPPGAWAPLEGLARRAAFFGWVLLAGTERCRAPALPLELPSPPRHGYLRTDGSLLSLPKYR